ncbi:MAG: carbohydrate-binding domain-containing protein [Prevotella sp.]|nr:carbohydrate-binding domain-containing protein [Prevotella sp.]
MRRIALFLIASVLTAMNAVAQTLNVTVGEVTYQFPAAQTGAMTFAGGSTLTIMGREFALSDISSMYTDETTVTDNLVSIVYNGTSATVTVAGNVAQYVTPTVSGAHVTIAQSNTAAVDNDEITYQLSGSSTDGEFALSGSYKCTVSLAGLTLTNPAAAAINITNSKRIQLSAKKNTTNTLTDGTGGSQKACIYSKGQLQLQGNGTLNVVGNTKHAIKSGDYISVKNLTLNVTAAVSDGINCEEYFQMKSGTVSISGVGDDGIQCDLGGTTSTGETTDHDDEDSGNIYLEGGTLNITVTAAATKGVKSEGDVRISGGTITIHSTGNATWDSDDQEVKGSKCISADGNMTVSGGTLVLTSTGSGGKGIKVDGTLTVSDDADLTVSTSGQIAYCASASNTTIKTATSSNTTEKLSDNLKTSPKGIKADGAMTIKGGTMNVSASYHEAIETKSTLDISGGYIYAYSGDDAINSASTMTISGGYIMANSSGNDGLDSNGNLNISGGNIVAVAAGSPEVGIDAAEQYKLNITGGNIIAIGGLESGYSLSGTAYQAASYSKGTWYGFYDNSGTLITAFKVPSNSSMGATMAVYSSTGTPTLKSGVTTSGTAYWNGFGNSGCSGGTAVTLSTYTGGNSGGPGGGGGPGGKH